MKRKEYEPYLLYAIGSEGKLVYIDDVPNGLACNCVCPHCKDKLIAKNGGEINQHSFSHCSGADCVGAVESALHLLAKEILSEEKYLTLPNWPGCMPSGVLRLDKVETEKYYPELKLRPDCVGYYNDKEIWIEFKRTHAVDVHKEGKIISAHIDCIEIDINGCKQDKEEVRKFITESNNNRIWIYNSEFGANWSMCRNRSDGHNRAYYSYYDEYQSERHYAIEDGIRPVYIYDKSFDAINHKYTCPSCGGEVFVEVGNDGRYSFSHIEDKNCDYALYLKNTAVSLLHTIFDESEQFFISVPQRHYCKLAKTCNGSNNACVKEKSQPFDIKKYGFTVCKTDYKFEDATIQPDIVFCNQDPTKSVIAVTITHPDLPIVQEDWKVRQLKISVRSEYDIQDLCKSIRDYKDISYKGFKETTDICVEPKETSRKFPIYKFYTSGKFFTDGVKCNGNFSKSTRSNVIKEVIFVKAVDNSDDMRNFILSKFQKLDIKLCYCHICFFLKHKSICSRWKTQGTPRKPLKETMPPVDCPYFSLDRGIEAHVAELSDKIVIIEF